MSVYERYQTHLHSNKAQWNDQFLQYGNLVHLVISKPAERYNAITLLWNGYYFSIL